MIFLRQSTASQEVPLGRFVDSTDGNTEETALTIANTDIKIWKTGATTLANKNSGGATHIANGEYYAVFDATDTDTIGPMKIGIHVAGALYIQVWATVLDEAVYDALFGTTALSTYAGADTSGTTTLLSRIGGAITITSGRVNADVTHIATAAVNTASAQLGVNVVNINAQTATAAAGVTFPSSIASPTNITAATGIVLSGVTHTGAVIPTVTTLTGHTAQTGDTYALANGANGFANIKSDTAAILVDTGTTLDARIPAALVGGRMDSSVGAVAAGASNIKKNTASAGFMFAMTDSTNHAPATGLTVTATRSIDGAAFAACANAVVELSNGVYTIDLAAADVNGNHIMFRFTAAAADDRLIELITQP